MKRSLILSSLLLLGIFVGTGFALPLPDGSIYDTYLHPNDNELVQRDDDVIGDPNIFNIYGHRWNTSANSLEIYLSWGLGLDGVNLGAQLGDVFFYNPSGTDLEYFVPLRNHDGYDDSVMQRGHVYNFGEPRLSDYYYLSTPTQQYGDNEIVTGVGGDTKIEAIVGYIDGTSYDTITLGFASTDFGIIDGRDIRFAFTCGNDVIAPASVPEPTTMFLLGIGLIGLAGVGRRKLKKS